MKTAAIVFICMSVCIHTGIAQQLKKSIVHPAIQKPVTITIIGNKNGIDLLDYHESYFGFNLSYLQNISEPEKAILGLIATYAGTECDWDGKANADMSNLSCKLTKLIGLGYQCAESHIGFLRKWFRNDTAILNELKTCGMNPYTAHSVTGLEKVLLTKQPGAIKIYYKGGGGNIRTETSWEWNETILFKVDKDEVKLISRRRSKLRTFK